MITNTFAQVTMMDITNMEPAAARMVIAQDVLALLKAQAIKPRAGRYIDKPLPDGTMATTPMHEIVESWLGECPVCAIGATMVAAIRRFDDLNAAPFMDHGLRPGSRPEFMRYLERFFSREQLDLIEIAFESTNDITGLQDNDYEQDLVEAAIEFRRDRAGSSEDESGFTTESDHLCLVQIFQNIIDNGGTFNPYTSTSTAAIG